MDAPCEERQRINGMTDRVRAQIAAPVLQGQHGTGEHASTTFGVADVVIMVDGQDHLFFRRVGAAAKALGATARTPVPIRSVTVIDKGSGLTSQWRDNYWDEDR